MVKRFLLLFFSLYCFSLASESAVLASRAQKNITQGKFAKGYSQLERSLLASRKESDLNSEGRILIAMARVRLMSLDLKFADSLLAIVRKEAVDNHTNLLWIDSKIALLNEQKKYNDAEKLCRSVSEKNVKKIDESIKAAFYSDCGMTYAALKKKEDSQKYLKQLSKYTDKDGGFYIYTQAKIASLLGDTKADSLFKLAEEKSIKANQSYRTATILWERSQLKTTSQKEKVDLKLRCKNAFELMGLPNNTKRCEK